MISTERPSLITSVEPSNYQSLQPTLRVTTTPSFPPTLQQSETPTSGQTSYPSDQVRLKYDYLTNDIIKTMTACNNILVTLTYAAIQHPKYDTDVNLICNSINDTFFDTDVDLFFICIFIEFIWKTVKFANR